MEEKNSTVFSDTNTDFAKGIQWEWLILLRGNSLLSYLAVTFIFYNHVKLIMHQRHLYCAYFIEKLNKHARPNTYNQNLISLLLLSYYDVS